MNTKAIQNASRVLNDYFGLSVPDSVIERVLSKDRSLFREALDGGISDTCQRDELIDAVMKEIGVGRYPCYGDSEEYKEKFSQTLSKKLIEVGGSFVV